MTLTSILIDPGRLPKPANPERAKAGLIRLRESQAQNGERAAFLAEVEADTAGRALLSQPTVMPSTVVRTTIPAHRSMLHFHDRAYFIVIGSSNHPGLMEWWSDRQGDQKDTEFLSTPHSELSGSNSKRLARQ